jgi:sulfonate transport system substrate-binding protein
MSGRGTKAAPVLFCAHDTGHLCLLAQVARLALPTLRWSNFSKIRTFEEEFMRSLKAMLASLAMVTALGAGAAQAADPVKIRLSWVAPVSNWGSILLEKKDLAKHLGKSYTLETIRFAGTPPLVTALAAGEIEIANFTFSTLPIAIQNAGISDLVVIADEFQDGVEGWYSNEFSVLKDGPIKKIADLKGKAVATNAAGSAVDVAMRAMLRKNGLEDKRDYTVVEAPFPAMRAMLADKKVDLITAVRPFSLDPELKKISSPLFTTRDAVGATQFSMWTVRKSFLDKNRAAMQDFMEDSLRIVKWYLDPKNAKEVAEIASRVTKQPPERFGWLFTKEDNYRDPDMKPNLVALQANMDTMKQLGFVKDSLDIKKHSDLSLIEEANKRLK